MLSRLPLWQLVNEQCPGYRPVIFLATLCQTLRCLPHPHGTSAANPKFSHLLLSTCLAPGPGDTMCTACPPLPVATCHSEFQANPAMRLLTSAVGWCGQHPPAPSSYCNLQVPGPSLHLLGVEVGRRPRTRRSHCCPFKLEGSREKRTGKLGVDVASAVRVGWGSAAPGSLGPSSGDKAQIWQGGRRLFRCGKIKFRA